MNRKYNALGRSLLLLARIAGKTDRKIIAVFGLTPEACYRAVCYVRAGAGGIPVWLFCTSQPGPQIAELCERVFVCPNAFFTLLKAERLLWRYRVALCVGTWTGGEGGWCFKLAPFLIPPFRALLLNGSGDFVNGRSTAVLIHAWRCIKARACTFWYSLQAAGHDASDALGLACRRTWGRARTAGHSGRDAFRACAVRCAAALLRLTGNPHRALFRRMHGHQTLRVAPPRPLGDAAAHFISAGRDWHGDAIKAEVAATDARWLIWNENGGEAAVNHLLPLFEDQRTFAVSVQCHVRGWSPSLILMTPFRPLQPNEATPVLAPLSDTMVVDRQKLAALPLPRCGLSATAWLDLFWRASAAGWRSYSVGRSGAPTPQPDYPAPEAEFFFRSLARPSLLRLGPQEPDLIRGNLAFRLPGPAVRAPASGRLRVLVVSPFLPFPLSHGGAVRIWNLCGALRDRVDFSLIAIREREERVDYDRLGEIFREVHVVDLDELPSADRDLPQQVRQHQSHSLAALVRDLSARLRPDLIQIEYTHLAHFLEAQSEIPCILVEHDITFSLYRQLMESQADGDARPEYERWRAYERRYLPAFDAVWTMSDDDRRLAIREGSPAEATFTIPNGVDTARFTPRHHAADSPEILYVGSFRHLPNLIGFEILCRDVMPQVWRSHPHARLRVVAGPQHEMFWQRFRGNAFIPADDRIEVQGFVTDLRPLYGSASVVAVPLAVSAGTNIKVLEAMACGKAIVSTPVGCAGLGLHNGEELLIREPGDFPAAVRELLDNEDLRADLGCAARHTAEQRFSWKAIADRAYRSYCDVWAPVARNEAEIRAS